MTRGTAASVDQRLADALTAALCAALALASVVARVNTGGPVEGPSVSFLPAGVPGMSLILLAAAALLLRRQHSIAVLVVVGTSTFLALAWGYPSSPLPVAELVILYTVASSLPTVVSSVTTGLITLSIVGATLIHEGALNDDKLVAYLMSAVAAWVLGCFIRVSRTQAAMAQENVLLLTQQQQARTQQALRQERERISRELHDVLGHSVGVMVAQASAARLVFWKQTDFAFGALCSIESTGRAALGETRALFSDLHADTINGTTRPPSATLAGLPALLERVEAAGLPVELVTRGIPTPVPPGVDLAAYRIVQESLTNCLRHADSAHAIVLIGYQADRLDVEVSDDGAEHPPGEPGHGLIGMRERATLLGGELTAGRVATGFQVRASLPFSESRP